MDFEERNECLGEVRKTASVFIEAGILLALGPEQNFVVDEIEDRVRVAAQRGLALQIGFHRNRRPGAPAAALVVQGEV
jgi:hypothetical protein